MVLRDAARFIVLLCQQLGLAARTAPVRLLLSSVPCAPVCGASVCQRCASSCETDRVAYIYSRLPPPPRIPPEASSGGLWTLDAGGPHLSLRPPPAWVKCNVKCNVDNTS